MSQKELARSEFKQMELKISDMCSDLDPSLITKQSAPSMDKELGVIGEAKDVYRNKVRNFLTSFESELTQIDVGRDKADMENLVKMVNSHKFKILAKVNELNLSVKAMSEFEKKSMDMQEKQLELQQKQLELQLKVGDSKKDEMHAVARSLKKIILEKCTELDDDFESIPINEINLEEDQLFTRTMFKLSAWQLKLEALISINREFCEKTALHPLPEAEQIKVTSAVESTKSSFSNIM